jgi:hypothetical protein
MSGGEPTHQRRRIDAGCVLSSPKTITLPSAGT